MSQTARIQRDCPAIQVARPARAAQVLRLPVAAAAEPEWTFRPAARALRLRGALVAIAAVVVPFWTGVFWLVAR